MRYDCYKTEYNTIYTIPLKAILTNYLQNMLTCLILIFFLIFVNATTIFFENPRCALSSPIPTPLPMPPRNLTPREKLRAILKRFLLARTKKKRDKRKQRRKRSNITFNFSSCLGVKFLGGVGKGVGIGEDKAQRGFSKKMVEFLGGKVVGTRPRSVGPRRKVLFGKGFSSDNAGDGPAVEKGPPQKRRRITGQKTLPEVRNEQPIIVALLKDVKTDAQIRQVISQQVKCCSKCEGSGCFMKLFRMV